MYACDVPSSATTSHIRSANSAEDRMLDSSGRYWSSTPGQSTSDMSGVQKSRAMIRPASSRACAHSPAGSARYRARVRSTLMTSSDEPLSAFRSDGTIRTSP